MNATHNLKQLGKTLAINLLVFFALLALIEIVFKVIELTEPSAKYPTLKAYRLSRPEPYKNSPYFSEEFINESFDQPKGWKMVAGTRIVLPNDYHGKYFNVQNNIRVTTQQNAQSERNIFIFGGSTVYDSEVPDDDTVASQLQRILNKKNLNLNVYNYGVTSIHAGQQLEKLKYDVKLHEKDLVIFYDGVNDVTQRVYYGNPDGWIAGEVSRAPVFVRGVRKLTSHSAFFRWLDDRFITKKHYEFRQDEIESAAQGYVETIKAAYQYTTNRGAFFYHFLQPNLATRRSLDPYEKKLIQSGGLAADGMFEAMNIAYPVFRNQLASLQYNHDLSDIFDSLESSPYLDICHINEIGNKRVAEALFREIQDEVTKPMAIQHDQMHQH